MRLYVCVFVCVCACACVVCVHAQPEAEPPGLKPPCVCIYVQQHWDERGASPQGQLPRQASGGKQLGHRLAQ